MKRQKLLAISMSVFLALGSTPAAAPLMAYAAEETDAETEQGSGPEEAAEGSSFEEEAATLEKAEEGTSDTSTDGNTTEDTETATSGEVEEGTSDTSTDGNTTEDTEAATSGEVKEVTSDTSTDDSSPEETEVAASDETEAGTPETTAANETAVVKEKPSLTNLTVDPSTVAANSTVRVSCNAASANGIASVTAWIMPLGQTEIPSEITEYDYTRLSMQDDGSYAATLSTSGCAVGCHKVLFRTVDNAGQVDMQLADITITGDEADKEAPTITDAKLSADTFNIGDELTVSAKVDDPNGVYQVDFEFSWAEGYVYTGKTDSDLYECKIPVEGMKPGKCTVSIVVTDGLGNTNKADPYVLAFTVNGDAEDHEGPAITVDNFLDGKTSLNEGQTLNFQMDVTDKNGVHRIRVGCYLEGYKDQINDSSVYKYSYPAITMDGHYTFQRQMIALKPGTYHVEVEAADKVGNSTTQEIGIFTLKGSFLMDPNSGVILSAPEEYDSTTSIKATDVEGNDFSNAATPVTDFVDQQEQTDNSELLRVLDIDLYINNVKQEGVTGKEFDITVPFDAAKASQYSAFYVVYLDNATRKPIEIIPATYDAASQSITFHTTHLSRYALVGVKKTGQNGNADTGNHSSAGSSSTSSSSSSSATSTSTATAVAAAISAPATTTVYRLYNAVSGEHFYTANAQEKDALLADGWTLESTNKTLANQGDPVYRLFNQANGEHFYTADAEEKDALVAAGFTDEGIAMYSDPAHRVPVYRLLNPTDGTHFFTTDEAEKDTLTAAGLVYEGIGWYVVK